MNDPRTGQADCGCIYHAEEGISCEHDLVLSLKPNLEPSLDELESAHKTDSNYTCKHCKKKGGH